MHSSSAVQPTTNVNADQLTGVGKEIDDFFMNEANLEKLIRFLCIEETKNEPLKCFNIAFFKVCMRRCAFVWEEWVVIQNCVLKF